MWDRETRRGHGEVPCASASLRVPAETRPKPRRNLICVLLLTACASTTHPPLRILTYNIHAGKDATGKDNLERVAAIVKSTNADVVLLQEVDRNTTRSGNVDQVAELIRLTGMHGQFGKSLDYQGGEYGIAILSRWPITGHQIVPLRVEPPQVRAGGSLEPRIALIVTTGSLRIANTHLDASREDTYRLQEIPQVLAAARGMIAGGDFNSTPDSAVHEQVLRAGRRDAWMECGRGDALTYPAITPQKRIDYLFLERGTRCSEATVIDTDASDHRPVLVVVE
ncbi:MAG TPA: endonuclease/exonuclease/phosphatase family protein [Thermoanaerobaculia bacterium]|nr:endonuclease/exonuclease/phosphatase family protein [Thermoanaerobaculia bacterium]